jgi:hypothetical protein
LYLSQSLAKLASHQQARRWKQSAQGALIRIKLLSHRNLIEAGLPGDVRTAFV